jgi:hypothetical protein
MTNRAMSMIPSLNSDLCLDWIDQCDDAPLDSTDTSDSDGDGVGDASDPFPNDDSESLDTDGDGIGNNADTDDDGDGVLDVDDSLPLDASESVDTDSDGIGNNADTDDDGDGVEDSSDAFPLDASETLDTDSDGIGNNADADDDGDGFEDISGYVLSGNYQGVWLGFEDRLNIEYQHFYNTSGENLASDGQYIYGCPDVPSGETHILRHTPGSYTTDKLIETLCSDLVVSDSYLFYLVGQVVGRYHLSTGIHDGTYFEASEGSSPLGLAHDGTGVYVFFENEALKINDSDQVQETINIRGGRQSTMTRDYYVLTGETLRLVSRTDSSLAEIEIDARSPLSAASDGRYVYAVFSESSDRRKIISYDTLTGSIQNLADRFGVGGLAVDGRGLWMTNRAMNKIIADSIQYACTTVIDGCDVFPLDPEEWFDTDKDGIGNNADTDDDGDGVLDSDDPFPLDASESLDTDSDGIGNNADTDDDGDGVLDAAKETFLNVQKAYEQICKENGWN